MASIDNGATRRQFMYGMGVFALAGCLSPFQTALAGTQTRGLLLEQCNTGEILKADYMVDGRFDIGALHEIDFLLRDWRTGDIKPIDRRLFDVLFLLNAQLPSRGPICIYSGYRTQATNDLLRRRGRGASKHSLHIRGMAIDFRLPGVKLGALRRHAMALEAGGVGYYPRSGFVHIDTGPRRHW